MPRKAVGISIKVHKKMLNKAETEKFMIDGHIHIDKELVPFLSGVQLIANADCPEEYEYLKSLDLPGMTISAGIHPWKAAETDRSVMEPILREAAVIGEIGMDGKWCEVPHDVQREVFEWQLGLAAELGKPVILHTKCMEGEILEIIKNYPNRYLVHWYDCENWMQEYIDLGCWFTIGQNVSYKSTVKELAENVPAGRILIESDGREGISWCRHMEEVDPSDYEKIMQEHLENTAAVRGVSPEELLEQMNENLRKFIQGRF